MRSGGSYSSSAELTVEPAGQPVVERAGAVRGSCPGVCNAQTLLSLSIKLHWCFACVDSAPRD